MIKPATQSLKAEREEKLKAWFEQVWKDGSYIYWVQEKYHCLDTPNVAKEILGAKDNSMFKGSGWAVWYRDEFNKNYNKKRKQQQSILASCAEIEESETLIDDKASDEFLESFLEHFLSTESSRALAKVDKDVLKAILTSYRNLSCHRYREKIGKLQYEIKVHLTQAKKSEKRILLMKEEITLLKTRGEEEERHFMGSIRNLYAYDACDDVDGDA